MKTIWFNDRNLYPISTKTHYKIQIHKYHITFSAFIGMILEENSTSFRTTNKITNESILAGFGHWHWFIESDELTSYYQAYHFQK